MEPINQFSPANVADWGKLSPARLLLLVLLWHAENTKFNLWPDKTASVADFAKFQNEWDTLCAALAKKLDGELAEKMTFSTIKDSGGKKVTTYSLSKEFVSKLALKIGLRLNQDLVDSVFSVHRPPA